MKFASLKSRQIVMDFSYQKKEVHYPDQNIPPKLLTRRKLISEATPADDGIIKGMAIISDRN